MIKEMEWNIRRYDPSDRRAWNEFVRNARNATFLFERGYMDYHSDRFVDFSFMVFKEGKLMALLPANIDSDGVLHSHQGLTYGGWILPPAHLDGSDLLDIFLQTVDICKAEGISAIDYKPLPWIYSGQPSEEDIYALFRLGAKISEVNLSSTINLSETLRYNKLRKRSLKAANRFSYSIVEITDSCEFMGLVAKCLRERHDTTPVHTPEEIEMLRDRFPDNIKMFGLYLPQSSMPEAGVMIYDTGRVAHAQYIASLPKGRELNLLTPLFDYLIRERYAGRAYFDFGISNEDHGLYLNDGLLRQKFSYGATGVAYQRWYIEL